MLASEVEEKSTNQIRQEEKCRPSRNHERFRRIESSKYERAMLRAKQQLLRSRVKTHFIFFNDEFSMRSFLHIFISLHVIPGRPTSLVNNSGGSETCPDFFSKQNFHVWHARSIFVAEVRLESYSQIFTRPIPQVQGNSKLLRPVHGDF